MLRVFLEIGLTFLAPFVVYYIYRLFRPDAAEATDAQRFRPYAVLALIGVLLVAASLIGGRLLSDRRTGAYVPATVKDGVLQPGRVE